MGSIVVSEFVSLDGVIETPGGGDFRHAGWTFEVDHGPGGRQFKYDELVEAEAQLLGRVTYEGFAAAWPAIEGAGEFGGKMNSMPKYVVSSTLTTADWNNSTILGGDPAEEVAGPKSRSKASSSWPAARSSCRCWSSTTSWMSSVSWCSR